MNKPKPKKINWNTLLFRASSFGLLMANTKGISESQLEQIKELQKKKKAKKPLGKLDSEQLKKLTKLKDPTEKQLLKVQELKDKKNFVKGLTTKQQEKLDSLIELRDKPLELSKGAKSYLKKMYREVKWNRRIPLESKFLDKGIFVEDEAIEMIGRFKGEKLANNKDRVNDKYFTGECDIIEGYDAKSSFWLDSFPEKDDPLPSIYEFQNRVYMILYGREIWSTIYVLLDLPLHMMVDMIYREGFKHKDNIVPQWRKMELINLYVYTEKSLFEFVKYFEVDFENDPKAVEIFNNFVEIPEDRRVIEKVVYRDKKMDALMRKVVRLARKELIRLDSL